MTQGTLTGRNSMGPTLRASPETYEWGFFDVSN